MYIRCYSLPQKQAVAAPSVSVASTAGQQYGGAPATKGAVAAALPEGFFADREADAKARGIKLPDAKDREEEFQVCGDC